MSEKDRSADYECLDAVVSRYEKFQRPVQQPVGVSMRSG